MEPLCIDRTSVRRILAIGAHPDDIEIGCGAAILRLGSQFPAARFSWAVFSGNQERRCEAEAGAAAFLPCPERSDVHLFDFRDGFFPYSGERIKDVFEQLKQTIAPDIVFTHYRDDRHQDHRLLSDLTWNTFRRATILEYEIPKYDGDFGSPNFFIILDRSTAERKVNGLLQSFPSQRCRDWFDEELFWSVMRIRGMEARSPHGYAEGFYCRKAIV